MLLTTTIHKAEAESAIDAIRSFEQSTVISAEIRERVSGIIESIREKGDQALFEMTERFDGVQLDASNLKVTEAEIEDGFKSLSEEDIDHIEKAKSQIEDFHRRTVPKDWKTINADGGTVGERFYPIRSVGLYVPGGNVPLVSSVLMSAVLAKMAGNTHIAVVTPPLKDGSISKGMLAAFKICGINEIYKTGGAQAIAALAYGTESVPAVDKIFGPGNAYVLEAKRQVFGKVGVDLLPGPSEVGIVADDHANPEWVAADLIAQAEHGSGKERVLLLVSSEDLLKKIDAAAAKQVAERSHKAAIEKVLSERCIIMTYERLGDAAKILNEFAPEHLELQVGEDSIEYLTRYVTTAGAMLLGHTSPTVLGDFTAGPSHTLPTGGAGRFMSGLRLTDFLRRTSIVAYDEDSLKKALPTVQAFSRLEQLDGHGYSAQARTN